MPTGGLTSMVSCIADWCLCKLNTLEYIRSQNMQSSLPVTVFSVVFSVWNLLRWFSCDFTVSRIHWSQMLHCLNLFIAVLIEWQWCLRQLLWYVELVGIAARGFVLVSQLSKCAPCLATFVYWLLGFATSRPGHAWRGGQGEVTSCCWCRRGSWPTWGEYRLLLIVISCYGFC